jgi:hypothetical protein
MAARLVPTGSPSHSFEIHCGEPRHRSLVGRSSTTCLDAAKLTESLQRGTLPAGRGDVRNDSRPLRTRLIGLAADRREARQGGRRTTVL